MNRKKTNACLASALTLVFFTFNHSPFLTIPFFSIFRYPHSETFPAVGLFPGHILPLLFLSQADSSLIPFTYNVSLFTFSVYLQCFPLHFLITGVPGVPGVPSWFLRVSQSYHLPPSSPIISKTGTQGDGIITLGAISSIMLLEQEHSIYPTVFIIPHYSPWLLPHSISFPAYWQALPLYPVLLTSPPAACMVGPDLISSRPGRCWYSRECLSAGLSFAVLEPAESLLLLPRAPFFLHQYSRAFLLIS